MAAQEGRHDTIWWSSAATRRRASAAGHPLPLLVTRELGAVQRTQRGPSRVVACSPRASGPAASDRTARERRLGCCGAALLASGWAAVSVRAFLEPAPATFRARPAALVELSRRSSRG